MSGRPKHRMTAQDAERWLRDYDDVVGGLIDAARAEQLATELGRLRDRKEATVTKFLMSDGFERAVAERLSKYLQKRLRQKGKTHEQIMDDDLDHIRAVLSDDDERWMKVDNKGLRGWVDLRCNNDLEYLNTQVEAVREQSVAPEHCGLEDAVTDEDAERGR
jgi:hypothetical protein